MASTASRMPTHHAACGGTDWAAEARRLAHEDHGGAPWITGLRQRVERAADEDLGTLIVARAALTQAAAAHDAEMARQRAQRAAELAREQQAEAARLQREQREAEEAQEREKRARREARARDRGFDLEEMLGIYGVSLVASLAYSFWVATLLQGCWGRHALNGGKICADTTMDTTMELGWPILVSSLVTIGLAFLLDVLAHRWMDPGWRALFGAMGVLAGLAVYSSNPSLSPWLVGGGWILGQLVEVATSVARAQKA